MHRFAIVIAIIAWSHSSCATLEVPTPPVVVHTSEGDVSAYSEDDARRIAGLLVDLAPKVRAVLVDVQNDPADVRVLDHAVAGFEDPCNYDRVIVMPVSPRELEPLALAHELVHWQLAGVWNMLPHTAQEGLADRIAFELVPDAQSTRAVQFVFSLYHAPMRDPIEALSLDQRQWSYLRDGKRKNGLYAMAFFVVTRIGIEPLRALCQEARDAGLSRVPAEWMLARANLSTRDVWDWEVKIDAALPLGARAETFNIQAVFD
jgi:hypothetical protein